MLSLHAALPVWPFAYLANHIDIRSATAKRITLERLPEFKPVPDTGEPLLPDLDIDVGRLAVDRLVFEPAVAGERQEARLSGKVAVADRRAPLRAEADDRKRHVRETGGECGVRP